MKPCEHGWDAPFGGITWATLYRVKRRGTPHVGSRSHCIEPNGGAALADVCFGRGDSDVPRVRQDCHHTGRLRWLRNEPPRCAIGAGRRRLRRRHGRGGVPGAAQHHIGESNRGSVEPKSWQGCCRAGWDAGCQCRPGGLCGCRPLHGSNHVGRCGGVAPGHQGRCGGGSSGGGRHPPAAIASSVVAGVSRRGTNGGTYRRVRYTVRLQGVHPRCCRSTL